MLLITGGGYNGFHVSCLLLPVSLHLSFRASSGRCRGDALLLRR
jgi:hypothetical protein